MQGERKFYAGRITEGEEYTADLIPAVRLNRIWHSLIWRHHTPGSGFFEAVFSADKSTVQVGCIREFVPVQPIMANACQA